MNKRLHIFLLVVFLWVGLLVGACIESIHARVQARYMQQISKDMALDELDCGPEIKRGLGYCFPGRWMTSQESKCLQNPKCQSVYRQGPSHD